MSIYFGEHFDDVAARLVAEELADNDLPRMSLEWHQAQQRREQRRVLRVHRDVFPCLRLFRWLP